MSALAYAPSLCPWLAHPWVALAGPDVARALLQRRLERYLHSVTCLELQVVNDVARSLALEDHLEVDERVRLGSLKLLTDESHHALEAAKRLRALTGRATSNVRPAFLTRLAALERGDAWLARWLFVTITETCLSASMRQLANDAALDPDVRAFVAQHAADEVWHGSFFGSLFAAQWPRLGAQRARAAELLPLVAEAYLAVDVEGVVADLRSEGFAEAEALSICEETRWVSDASALEPTRAWLKRARLADGASSPLDGVLVAHPFHPER